MTQNDERKRAQDTVYSIFAEDLGGHRIAETTVEGNNNLIQWWSVDGSVVIVTLYFAGGWDYHLPGKQFEVDRVADDIRAYFDN